MLTKELFEMQDIRYRNFHAKLMPTVSKDKIIGIRVPVLRKFSKIFFSDIRSKDFMQQLPHRYYEEDNIHAFLIEQISDFDTCIKELEQFLPCIDNWATCDMLRPKIFKKHPEKLFPYIQKWMKSKHTYTVRFAIGMLLSFYLADSFTPEHLTLVSAIKSDDYYINMMIAWYFATALAFQYEHTLPYITKQKLPVWIHNKTIQKAKESFRISKERKNFLQKFKIK